MKISDSLSEKRDEIQPAAFRIVSLRSNGAESSLHLEWAHQPHSALLVEKMHDQSSRHFIILAARYLFQNRNFTVYVEEYVKNELSGYAFLKEFTNHEKSKVDFVLAFGGDGTLLHISKLFPKNCPPIVPFAMGSLGFLTPFLADEYQSAIDGLIRGFFSVISRTRILCSVYRDSVYTETFQAMNDIVILSAKNGTVSAIDCFIDDEYFTTVYGDGLIVATSTGSTAYNLSAGGVMVHPSVSSLLWTPICAHALNAHPLVLPDSIQLAVQISPTSRGDDPYIVTFDSSETTLGKKDKIVIRVSPYPVPTVCRKEPMTEWLNSISSVLKWNQPIQSQSNTADDDSQPRRFFVCNTHDIHS